MRSALSYAEHVCVTKERTWHTASRRRWGGNTAAAAAAPVQVELMQSRRTRLKSPPFLGTYEQKRGVSVGRRRETHIHKKEKEERDRRGLCVAGPANMVYARCVTWVGRLTDSNKTIDTSSSSPLSVRPLRARKTRQKPKKKMLSTTGNVFFSSIPLLLML